MTDADLITALRQRGWTDCADAIEAGQRLEPVQRASLLPWAARLMRAVCASSDDEAAELVRQVAIEMRDAHDAHTK